MFSCEFGGDLPAIPIRPEDNLDFVSLGSCCRGGPVDREKNHVTTLDHRDRAHGPVLAHVLFRDRENRDVHNHFEDDHSSGVGHRPKIILVKQPKLEFYLTYKTIKNNAYLIIIIVHVSDLNVSFESRRGVILATRVSRRWVV